MRYPLLLIWLLSAVVSFAGEPDSMQSYKVPGVIIEAERDAAALFDGEFVRSGDLPAGEAADRLLLNCTECFVKDYGPGALSTISIRGLSAGQTKVFWGELPIENPMLGQTDLSLLNIHPGQGISLNGDNRNEGAGGELLISSVLFTDSFRVGIYQQLGSFMEVRTSFEFQSPITRRISTYTSFQRSASNNDFSYQNPHWGSDQMSINQHGSFEIWSVQQGLKFELSDRNSIKVEYWGTIADRQLAPLMTEWTSRKAQMDDIHRTKIEGQFATGIGNFKVFSGYVHHRNQYHDTSISLYSENVSQVLSNGFSFDGSKNAWSYGGQFRHDWQHGESNTYSGQQHGFHTNLNLAYKFELKNFDLRLFSGLKHSFLNKKSGPLSPESGVDLSYTKRIRWQVIYKIGRQYRFPTLNDLFWNPGGNPNLIPEEGWGTEMTSRIDFPWGTNSKLNTGFSVTGYYQRLRHYILWTPDLTGLWQAENLDQVKAFGFEGQISQDLSFKRFSVNVSGKYAYQRIGDFNEENLGLQHIYAPEHQFSTGLQIGFRGFSFRSDIRYVSRRFTARDHSSSLDPFWVMDAALVYNMKLSKGHSLQFGLYGSNLTNQQFQVVANRPMAGASIRGSIAYRFSQKMNRN